MDFYWTGPAAGAKIFDIIRQQGPISRAAICKLTGQARSTMSLHIEQLLKLQLIEEIPQENITQPSDSVSKRNLLQLSNETGFFLAIFIGLTHFKVALCRSDASIIEWSQNKSSISDGPDIILAKVLTAIEQLLLKTHIKTHLLLGVGLAISGPIDYRKGLISSPVGVVSSWHNFAIKEQLQSHFKCPVIVDNDVHAMALGEQLLGGAKKRNNFIMVKLSTGIGASIVTDGRLYRGAKGSAGFISHNQVADDLTPCICGKQGCLEVVAGGAAIAKQGMEAIYDGKSAILAQILQSKPELLQEDRPPQIAERLPELLSRNIGRLTPLDVAKAANLGDAISIEILQKSARAIGSIMAQQVNFNNPSLLVFSGSLIELGDNFLAIIKEVIFAKAMPLATADLDIQFSQLAGMEGVIGACRLIQEDYYAFDNIKAQLEQQKNKR